MSADAGHDVHHAYDVLRGIRRVRTTAQLQEACDGLLAFVRTTHQLVEAQAAKNAAPGMKDTSEAYLQVSSNPSAEAQAAMSQLKQVSLLCGAFCRRVEHVLRTTYTYADVDDASHGGLSTVHVSAYMAQLTKELQRFNTPAVNHFLAAATKTDALSTSTLYVSSVDCVLSYGIGDLCDYRLCRRKRAQAYLQQLLAQPQWNAAAITQIIVSLNETLSTPVDPFAVCTSDESVEATCVVTPLRDPISQTVIRIPARGEKCVHLELFDVESFVQATQQRSFNTVDVGAPCPLCSRTVHLLSIRVDTRALEAMRSYERAATAAVSSSSSSDAPPPLTADCALEWNTDSRTVMVVRGRRGASAEESAVGEDQEEPATPSRGQRADASDTVTKKRRIEIGGHVLYAD
ncbi:conserved hypothetical protein [Leishmania major strain Friedlin]|uniref:SP-RING-type domain-containing protein n=1 Tax=Leishmania major TaxID=5664 RepID=E9AEB4_LEIMA|nr:conserved hypothetical protein [Leishmania major strain Friedlin]CAG9577993.1 MIZ/SP-RING_zinc_finger_containing_protein_-_putative [Leishmania major strain Friedlin]CBZ12593.1 conserved hypothetical protein [Leishmania major strain Friedlin]|eukprot:XP_003722335.1 conserved hypothetical protein [Leishmania major strain Friedlin]